MLALIANTSNVSAANRNVPGTYATIQAGINAASNGDTVILAPGTYTGTGNRDLSFGGKAITVTSSAGATTTIINCQGSAGNPHQGFVFNSGESSAAVLRGVTIQNAYRPYTILGISGGGAIQIDGASPIINQCVFKNNVANTAGAIYVSNGSPLITQCDFFNNLANISILNVNDYGGAIYVSQTLLTTANVGIADCVFSGNLAASDGGAIGVGGLLSGLNVVIYNCSFYNNNAFGVNELISLSAQPGTLSFAGGNTTVTNCILWNDASPAELSTALPILVGSAVQFCDIRDPGYAGNNGNINADPKYINAAGDNFHLGSGSPCINTGTSAGAPPVDHDGTPWSGGVSMGAFDATPPTHFSVVASGAATAGTATTFTVTALDGNNNTSTTYSGTVHFTSSDPQAILPANATLTNGTGTFSATLKTSGPQTITATDTANSSVTGTSNTITVSSAAATRLSLTVPVNATAGVAQNVTVRALDVFGNTATGYTGTVHLTSTDAQAVLPADSTLTGGVKTFSVTFKTVGNQTVTVTDTVTSSINGTSGAINVVAGAASRFTVTAPTTATAGTPISITVTAFDAFGNTATGYTGTIHFTSTEAGATLPADATLTNGTGTFSATLKTVGNKTITVKDTANASITGTTPTITVSPGPATQISIGIPAAATAGTPISVTVKALDAFGNRATTYAGTIHFTSTDPAAVLPANATLSSGAGSYTATFKTAGSQTITATDTVNSSITGTSNPATVTGGAATHLSVTTTGTGVAGSPTTVTVTAVDAFGNPTASYSGTIHFTSTDAQAGLPANATLANGTGTFTATLKTAGLQTITATDTVTPSITGTSTPVNVTGGTAATFNVTTSGTATAGSPTSITVNALDAFGNPTTSYNGTVHFTSTDGQAALPANATLTNGTGTFTATLKTAGPQTITATDIVNSTIKGTSDPITVTGGAAAGFSVTTSGTGVAGSPTTITVTAVDAFGNPTASYSGTIHFTSTDAQAGLPANATLANGTGTFTATLKTAGPQTITATDTVTPSITGTSTPVNVTGGAATHFTVTSPSTTTAGSPLTVTVSAIDAFGNRATSYNGTVYFTSTDGQAILPANATLTNGTRTFAATLKTGGAQTITATDTVNSVITGTTAPIAVSAGGATHISVTTSGTGAAGSPITVTVTALDAFGNPDTTYTGPVHFTSTDAQAGLPTDATLTNGTGTFTATLETAGPQTITATDTTNPSITGTSAPITITAGAATSFTVSAPSTATAGTPVSVTVTALDTFGNTATAYTGSVHFSTTDARAVPPANITLTNGTGTASISFKTAGTQTVTASDSAHPAIKGTSDPITVSAGTTSKLTVTAPATATAGTAISVTVSAIDAFGNASTYNGTVKLTSTDTHAVLPANSTLTNGAQTFSVTLKTTGTQTITATDTVITSIKGTSGSIAVSPGPAVRLGVVLPSTGTAGVAVNVTVTAYDAFNNIATGYMGIVHFTSFDPRGIYPPDSPLTNGVRTFSVTFLTAAPIVIRARDTVNTDLTATAPIMISANIMTHIGLTSPATAVSNSAFYMQVSAQDAYNNTILNYTGTVHFTSTDPSAVLPANSVLPSGSKQFSFKLKLVGTQTVSATDVSNPNFTGTGDPISVVPAPARLVVTAPETSTAGTPVTFTVTATDQSGNLVTGYNNTLHFTSTDPIAVLPADTAITGGTGTYTATLNTSGGQMIIVTDTTTSSLTGRSNTVTVSSATPAGIVLSTPSTAIAAIAFNAQVTAVDTFGNTVTSYNGTIHFTSSDPNAVLPADTVLSHGTKAWTFKLRTAGNQTISATDVSNSAVHGTSNSVTVSAGAPIFVITAPSTATAGMPITFTVNARDIYGNNVTTYTGRAHFTSSDAQAQLPADSQITGGTGTFTATFKTSGANNTITATDVSTPSTTGKSNTVGVTGGAATHFRITVPASATLNSAFIATVAALDAFGNVAMGYNGTVHFSSSDPIAVLPANGTIPNGSKAFSIKLKTTGNQTLTVTDTANSSVTGTSSAISAS